MDHNTSGGVGCLVAGAGAATAMLAWAPLARVNIVGGFEGRHRDLSVLYVDLPLVALGGALVPLVALLLTWRLVGRPWIAVLTAVAVLGLGVWGLVSWWVPYERPEFVY